MRNQGKSYFQKIAIEEALEVGKRVGVCNKDGIDIQRRKKHLTLHEFIPYPRNAGGSAK